MSTTPIVLPTKRIAQLPPVTLPLTGTELVETVQAGVSSHLTTRAFVLPTDPLITLGGMSGFLPGSRQLISSASIVVVDEGNGGNVYLELAAAGIPYVPETRAINTQHSIQGGGDLSADRMLLLVGDVADPGVDMLYGTDAAGIRGWIPASSVGETVHGNLTGLDADDHPQYLTEARGDARYYTEAEADALFLTEAEADLLYAPIGGGGGGGYPPQLGYAGI